MRFVSSVLIGLCLLVSSASFAEQIIQVQSNPTTTIVTVWDEFQTTDGGLNNANAWVNVWPGDGKIGFYGYTQIADPSFTQLYGGLAGRTSNGTLEGGVGIGVENAGGDIGFRRSVYGTFSRGRFSSANWYESSSQSGWWFLSQNMYFIQPDHVEIGYRMQRFLGGGPMFRYTEKVKRWTLQPYGAMLYDGDRVNPLIALSLTYK